MRYQTYGTQAPYDQAGAIDLPPCELVIRGKRKSMVIIVPSASQGGESQPSYITGRAPAGERPPSLNMTNTVYRPDCVVDEENPGQTAPDESVPGAHQESAA